MIHIELEDVMKIEDRNHLPVQAILPGSYVAEASDLGFPVGQWPTRVRLGTETLELTRRSENHVVYWNLIRTCCLTVWND